MDKILYMPERILDEDDMGWIAIRVLARILDDRSELKDIPENYQSITEDNTFINDLHFYTGGYTEKDLAQFFRRLEEFNTPPDLDEFYDPPIEPNDSSDDAF